MRIVAGSARGRRITTVEGADVRPTMDRVREAVFNSLSSHDLIEDRTFLDLFAGTGALGLEALSRGAASVTFVDRDRRAIAAISTSLATFDLAVRADVRIGDSLSLLSGLGRHDVALLDPPYGFDGWTNLLQVISADVVVIESDRPVVTGDDWETLKEKRYAGTVVHIAARSHGSRDVRDGAPAAEGTSP